jgi:hypothetical protein
MASNRKNIIITFTQVTLLVAKAEATGQRARAGHSTGLGDDLPSFFILRINYLLCGQQICLISFHSRLIDIPGLILIRSFFSTL